ncbi:uncharacterized protein LOC141907631 [Tubulanus polymorphus]|uniref:uncharacterized protein LOC141907631 n=1 Tax=Tubulanus polymorphus TaxID=672921 RepID=UPI003DA533AB
MDPVNCGRGVVFSVWMILMTVTRTAVGLGFDTGRANNETFIPAVSVIRATIVKTELMSRHLLSWGGSFVVLMVVLSTILIIYWLKRTQNRHRNHGISTIAAVNDMDYYDYIMAQEKEKIRRMETI